ncbi:MAG: hypothetical protein DME28_01995 [Verrucomicrobia bacterium]|nr:MAG: hypothetical protein DME28_01995 [Verrucomicrobiota bacterium]
MARFQIDVTRSNLDVIESWTKAAERRQGSKGESTARPSASPSAVTGEKKPQELLFLLAFRQAFQVKSAPGQAGVYG